MIIRRSMFGLVAAGFLAASVCTAAPPTARVGVEAASVPSGTAVEVRQALQAAVAQHLTAAGLGAELEGYSLAPALLQLRRYVDPGQKRTKIVCVVGLTVQNEAREVVGEIRGSAATLGASPLEAVDAAAHSAVLRMADSLAELKSRSASKRWARR